MIAIALAALLGAGESGEGWQAYTPAYHEVMEAGRPLLVLVSADWCGPCQRLKASVLPDPRIRKLLEGYVCARVDVDEQPGLADKLGGDGGVPLLVLFRKTDNGWRKQELRGYQSVEELASFIDPGKAAESTKR